MTEFKIPVPWGFIAARSSGEPVGRPVLMVHGLQDNLGTFDRLLPLLPDNHYYVSIDLPGHGRSSHFPAGMPFHILTYVTSLKRVVDHLKWERFIYVGHSIGGLMGIFFAGAFPEQVEKLALLDSLYATITHVSKTAATFRQCTLDLLAQEQKLNSQSAPVYSYDEAVKKIAVNRFSNLSRECAEILVQRSLIERGPNKYTLSTDQRLKLSLQPFYNCKQQKNFMDRIQCPVLTIFAKTTYDYSESQRNTHQYLYQDVKDYRYRVVEGQHDVHLQHPERVAPLLTQFLLDSPCKL